MGYPKQPNQEQVRKAESRLVELVKAELVDGRIVRGNGGLICCAACKRCFATRQAVWVHYGKAHAQAKAAA